MVGFGGLWWGLKVYGGVWEIMVEFESLWWGLGDYGGI